MCRFTVESVYSHFIQLFKVLKLPIFNYSLRLTFVLSKVYNSMENTSAVRILRSGFHHTTYFGYLYFVFIFFQNLLRLLSTLLMFRSFRMHSRVYFLAFLPRPASYNHKILIVTIQTSESKWFTSHFTAYTSRFFVFYWARVY